MSVAGDSSDNKAAAQPPTQTHSRRAHKKSMGAIKAATSINLSDGVSVPGTCQSAFLVTVHYLYFCMFWVSFGSHDIFDAWGIGICTRGGAAQSTGTNVSIFSLCL